MYPFIRIDGLKDMPPARPPAILDHLSALADPTRSRLLLLLERREFTVTELCAILQLPQSTVSRHLKALADSEWIVARAEATSNVYTMQRDDLDPPARRLWSLVREQVSSTSAASQDVLRMQSVLSARRTKSQEFFSSSAGQWDRLRGELFGDHFHFSALAGLAEGHWIAGDLGCGTGQVSRALAPFVARVIAVDTSAAMLQAARRLLHGLDNVELRRGELESLPIDDTMLDLAVVTLVLHHVPEPDRALAEMSRVLKPGGRLLVTDMLPHDREIYRRQMGHVWLGFSTDQVMQYLVAAGFVGVRVVPLPAEAEAKGPALFTATATRA